MSFAVFAVLTKRLDVVGVGRNGGGIGVQTLAFGTSGSKSAQISEVDGIVVLLFFLFLLLVVLFVFATVGQFRSQYAERSLYS